MWRSTSRGIVAIPVCFIDSVVYKVKSSGLGCSVNMTYMNILLYADYIILVPPHQ